MAQSKATDVEAVEPEQKASVNDVTSIPDGGLKAWIQVFAAFFVYFSTWGNLNTFGAYQTYYETQALFSASSSTISWIGSVQSSLLLILGLATGPLYDAGYFRVLMHSGAFLIVFGTMMISLCREYWQVLLAQGFCVGIGTGLVFIPGVAIISTYFSNRLALATGVAAAGSGLGGIIYPIIFHRLIDRIGFGWTVRAIGLVIFVSLLIPLLIFRVRVKPAGKRKILDLPAFKEPAYTVFVLGAMLAYITINIPFYYIQYFALTKHLAAGDLPFYLLSIITTGSIFGRILPNYLANKIGAFNIISICSIICGGTVVALVDMSNLPGAVIVSLLYGFFSGAVVSLPPTCFVKLSPDRSLIGTRMGMGYGVMMIGNLIGSPVAGAILQDRGFNAMWIFGGVTSMAGGIVMMISRCIQGKWEVFAKV
ncbi:putative monocarboxylate permease [Aspergillus clavatus NRRL 1]|uniref:Monocarboxylate permease, putative n=1 Tax=Aspergillus clavatus (strain ATCC 1007 / CBS 513.65 / DSM 816 / NCTC 3887 / NRRL 1 / QM 1276 / 107) TaxID=344612 RepID=A1CLM9_ASPCL|nr:monocarboxylate permease, putative [Aspergillus clavatus NRRL 1]EAW09008.1 monocarboxylate permease, putative [Aspergillus clavatus NRRL 1]